MHDIASELDALYGTHTLASAGVIHPTHVARAADGRLHALRIDQNTPRSETDWFVLSLCRARADAVLTSAENIRREPHLEHRLSGEWSSALSDYRREVLGKHRPLSCAILTRRGELPAAHPVWSDGTQKYLFTLPESESSLRARFADRAEVIGLANLDAALACLWLEQHGHTLISIEAGPSTASVLYTGPRKVDELWLTVWESMRDEAALAGALPSDALLFAGLERRGVCQRVEQAERFRFELWCRQHKLLPVQLLRDVTES